MISQPKWQNRPECNFLKEKVLEALENPVKREFSRAFLRSIFDFYDVIENKRLETEEKQYYDCCGAVTVGQEPHEWEDGKCAECGYGCTHSGGTATCTARAVCELCGQPYGDKDPDNHTGQETWVTTAESHTKVYSCCKAVIQQSEAHTWNDEGRCSVCGYGCTHSGGTATCTQQAVCEICGAPYGDPDPGNHTPSEVWTQENGKHYHVCLNGCETHLDEEACSGGTAACTAKAVCQVCGRPYGDLDPDNHINLTEVEAVAATQQADGNTAYWYCEECGRYFADADASEEISQEDTVIDFGTRLFFLCNTTEKKKI